MSRSKGYHLPYEAGDDKRHILYVYERINKLRRSEMREASFLLIFERIFRMNDTYEEILETAHDADEYEFNEDAVGNLRGVYENLDAIDGIIASYSEKRQISRISKVSLAVLRLAIYEINFCEKVPTNVAISEAVNLAKKFALDTEVQFVNGVLGAYSRDLAEKDSEAAE